VRNYDARDTGEFVNVGVGQDLPIRALAETVARVVGFAGELAFDASKPDGAPRKLLDVSRLTELGWRAKVELEAGIASAYADFVGRFAASSPQKATITGESVR
jgi:GDP-L-fucose synthase